MRKIFIIFCVFFAFNCKGQNLVLNPSFEDTIPCGSYQGPPQLPCSSWFWASSGSSDFFSEQPNCMYTLSAPSNFAGFQYARTGIAYSGLGTYVAPFTAIPEYREYIEGVLADTLKAGHIYCVSFYVSAADRCKFITDAIGAYFSVDSIYEPLNNSALSNFLPQINNPSGNIISDTLGWTLVSGTYTAQGGEKYITIGNFYGDNNMNIDSLNNNAPLGNSGAYFFIDDVSVIDCTVGINEVNDNLSVGKLYPNPARTAVYYESELNDNENGLLELYDMLGNKLSAYTLNHGKNKITIETSGYARGVYMVKVNITDRQPEFIKLVLQ